MPCMDGALITDAASAVTRLTSSVVYSKDYNETNKKLNKNNDSALIGKTLFLKVKPIACTVIKLWIQVEKHPGILVFLT